MREPRSQKSWAQLTGNMDAAQYVSSAASSLGTGMVANGSAPSDDERDLSGRTISFEDTLARSSNFGFTVGSPDSSGTMERTDRGLQFSPNQIR